MSWARAGWALLAFAAFSFIVYRVVYFLLVFLALVGLLVDEVVFALLGLVLAGFLAAVTGVSWLGARGAVWPFFAWLVILPLGLLIYVLLVQAWALQNAAAWLMAYASAGLYTAAIHVVTALFYAKAYKATGVEEMRKAGRRVIYGAVAAVAMPLLHPACAIGDALALRTAVKKALGR